MRPATSASEPLITSSFVVPVLPLTGLSERGWIEFRRRPSRCGSTCRRCAKHRQPICGDSGLRNRSGHFPVVKFERQEIVPDFFHFVPHQGLFCRRLHRW